MNGQCFESAGILFAKVGFAITGLFLFRTFLIGGGVSLCVTVWHKSTVVVLVPGALQKELTWLSAEPVLLPYLALSFLNCIVSVECHWISKDLCAKHGQSETLPYHGFFLARLC